MSKKELLFEIFEAAAFTNEELESVLGHFKSRTFQKGEYLLRKGYTANHYWYMAEGFIRSYAIDTEGNDVTTNFFTVKDIVIDWPSFFMRNPSRENIQALTDCSCWQLDFETFQRLFHSNKKFREFGRSNLVRSYFELKNHTTSLITDQARERYLRLIEEKKEIVQNVSLKQIATYLGITDSSLSRIRKEIAQNR
ncbi:MAG: Crp/Fnr family transcriptional regulator [Bacteroidota bacterium]